MSDAWAKAFQAWAGAAGAVGVMWAVAWGVVQVFRASCRVIAEAADDDEPNGGAE